MKKKIICLILMLSAILFAPSVIQVYAEDEVVFNTIYPSNVLDYTNLNNINLLCANEDNIAYTLSDNTLTIFDTTNKTYFEVTGFNNIRKIKYYNSNLIVADDDGIRVINNHLINNASQLNFIDDINYTSLTCIDIYVEDNTLYIGLVEDTTFKLYKYSSNLQPIETNPAKTLTSSEFLDNYMLTIDSNKAYIVTKKTDPYPKICLLNYIDNTIVKDTFLPNSQVMDIYHYNNTEYIIVFTEENLHILSYSNNTYNTLDSMFIGTSDLPFQSVSDIDYFVNTIYISDNINKAIQTFIISINEENKIKLANDQILLSSSSSTPGRFNNVQDIFVRGNILYTADRDNDRIQIINNLYPSVINLGTDSLPNTLEVDSYNNLYVIKHSASNSTLLKYTNQTLINEYNKINNELIGLISDITITNNNVIYLLDYTNNALLYLSSNGLESKKTLTINLNSNSQLEYIKNLNVLTILNDHIVYVIGLDGNILASIEIANCREITCDLGCIYAITDTSIIALRTTKIENNYNLNTLSTTFYNTKLSTLSSFRYNTIDRIMYCFNTSNQCLVYFELNLIDSPYTSEVIDSTPLSSTDMVKPLLINSNASPIYDYPYYLGNYYNEDKSIQKVIAIDEFEDYYKILFNYQDKLKIGYIPKVFTTEQTITNNPISVKTTNQLISIYKYPTVLKYNDSSLVCKRLPINTTLTLSSCFPISIDGKTFYLYKFDDKIGFIFNADVVLNDDKTITYLQPENATIKVYSNEKVFVYDRDNNIIDTLYNLDKIYVEYYNKDSKYTHISYKDDDLNTIDGYILTKYINMNKLNTNEIVILIIIATCFVIIVLLLAIYFIIKKRKTVA